MKSVLTIILVALIGNLLFAQGSFTDLKVGFLMPKDAKTGFMGGIGFGKMIDESVGIGVELGYYGKTYTEESTVDNTPQGQVNEQTVVTEIENSTIMLPVLFHLSFLAPMGPNFDLRFTGGIGYEFMWNSEKNYVQNIDETRFYSGFAWYAGGGASTPISRNSDLFAEIMYHSSAPSRDEGETDFGLPIRTEVDMSGLLFRAGIRLYGFGF